RVDLQKRSLAPEQVEVLRRGRAVGDADVDVGGELEKTLGPGAGVIGPLPFMAVWQQQHERRLGSPLAARRDQELVDHHLRTIDEIAVLRFPDQDRKSTRLNSSHVAISYAVFCLKKKKNLGDRLQTCTPSDLRYITQ